MNQEQLQVDVAPKGSEPAGRASRQFRDLPHEAARRGGLAEKARRPIPAVEGALASGSSRHYGPDLQADDVLPRHYFLKQLEREKRRTDRSRASLSLVLFRFDVRASDLVDDVDKLLRALCRSKRETDIVGYLSDYLIAVLLVDTDKHGTLVLTQKVVAHAGRLPVSTTAATYPDRVFDELKADNQSTQDPDPFLLSGLASTNECSYRLKRTLDIVGGIAALVLLSPLMLLIATAVAATSRGPVIFKQVRLGRGGIPFNFYKFRSMHCKADDQIHRDYVAKLIAGELEGINQGEAATPLYKMKDDPRITRVGKLIRKTSIDELPQLFNVLKGDMSLVGPRPPLPYEAEKYQSWHLRRILEVKPGITGIWQVNGWSKTSFDEMVRMDLRYVRTCSLALDLKLLLKTIKVVLHGEAS